MRHVLLAVALLAAAGPAAAVDQKQIDEAIRKGADYLRAHGGGDGGGQNGGSYGTGSVALAGMALLEAGAKPAEVAPLAQRVRIGSLTESATYQVSLGILFLDRNGDSRDVPLIQVLGCRLLAGQTAGGGWTYQTFDPIPEGEAVRLQNTLYNRAAQQPKAKEEDDDGPVRIKKPTDLHPEAQRLADAVRKGARAGGAMAGSEDNSNTQFAVVALWVARRRGVPCDAAIQRIEGRFLRSQSPADHGWGYGSHGGGSSPSMTCAGLLGLAVAKAHAEGKKKAAGADKPKEDDPFFGPPSGEDDEGKKKDAPVTARDAAIKRGLTALGGLLTPAGNTMRADTGMGGVGDLYFMWSLERVAVAFGLETIGDVDWYKWGAAQIVPSQGADGSWSGTYNSVVTTSFAVLFLAKANFTSDLTRDLGGKVKDPGGAELRGSRGGPIGIAPTGRSPEAKKADPAIGPGVNAAQGPGEIEKLADALVNAEDADYPKRLAAARDRQGAQYTACLVQAIPRMEGRRQYQAREALADRLFRMTPDTLRKMLADRDPELRRGASLAAAMRDERALIPDLIDRLTDIDDGVVRVARAGLKTLTSKDFGPPSGASDELKRKAADDWRFWYAAEGKGK